MFRTGHRARKGDLPRAGQGFGEARQDLDKIADGKLEKYFGDFCLVEQAFIKDPDRKRLAAPRGRGEGRRRPDRGERLRTVPGRRRDGEAVGRPGRRGGEAARAGVIASDPPPCGGCVEKPSYRRILLKTVG